MTKLLLLALGIFLFYNTAMLATHTTKPKPFVKRRITLEEFWQIPEGPPNFEFEDGELIPMVSPTSNHQQIVGVVFSIINAFIRQGKLGRIWPEVDVHLPNLNRVYIPDLVFLSTEKLGLISPKDGKIHGTPDLVIEILSPSTQGRDRTSKRTAYQRAGVVWYWIVDTDSLTIEEHRLTPEGYLISQSIGRGYKFVPGLFPELTIDLAELLDEPSIPEPDRDDERPQEPD